jgi:hypothetical protein
MLKKSTDNETRWHLFSRKSSYSQLLTILIVIFFLDPLLPGKVGNTITSVSFLLANLWQINTLGLPKNILFIFRNVAITAFILRLINLTNTGWLADWTGILSMLLYLLFIGLAILAISNRVFVETKVTQDLIRGGICIFLMLGLFWSLLYQIVIFFSPESFKFPATENFNDTLTYFSFTTLTTLGFGDVTPATPFARALTNAEAVVGQLYPSIYIARLVALWQPEKQNSISEEEISQKSE